MFCDLCSKYTKPQADGLCNHCRTSANNGEKIVGGAVIGGLVGGPVGAVVGGILGGLFGENNNED